MRKSISIPALILTATFTVVLIFSSFISGNDKPTVYIIGDSTVKHGAGNGDQGLWGWGELLHHYFDTTKVNVENHAIGGRSSRSFHTEGRWQRVLDQLKPGDYVLMQFGHNDGGPFNTGRARASLKGTGNETIQVIMEATGKPEVVHTYGWYMRKYIDETRDKGAHPIVFSLIPRNIFEDGKVMRAAYDYGLWAKTAAAVSGGYFIDLNEMVAEKYEKLGSEKVSQDFFLEDHTHTSKPGAILNAETVIEGISELDDCQLKNHLSDRGWSVIGE